MAGMRREVTAEEVRALLGELGQRLAAKGVEATIYIVGGAAIALELDPRRVTVDVDGVFHPETTVRDEARAMAKEHELPEDWLNDNAKAFTPGGDRGAVSLDIPGLSVALASPEHLLAIKMASFRPGQDLDDLELLFRTLRIATPEEAAEISTGVYGEYSVVLPGWDELLLSAQAVIDRMRRRRGV
jgi:hypothetical protein